MFDTKHDGRSLKDGLPGGVPEQCRHRAYGLSIISEIPLPELEHAAGDSVDVTIQRRPIGPVPRQEAGSLAVLGEDAWYLGWPRIGGFLVRDARSIDVEAIQGVNEPLLRLPLLGPVMALLLHLRGLLVLHASAVSIAGQGVVFLGDKQAGKSSTAAAFVEAGHALLADDVLAVDFSGFDGPRIEPGFPQLKLDPRAADVLIRSRVTTLSSRPHGFQKQLHLLTARFSPSKVPPARIYVLERGPVPCVIRIGTHDALLALVRFSYLARFGENAIRGGSAATHLRQCATLADAVPVSRLQTPSGLDRLEEVVRLVERDLA